MLITAGKGRQVELLLRCTLSCLQLAFCEVFFHGIRDLETHGYVNNPNVLFTQG